MKNPKTWVRRVRSLALSSLITWGALAPQVIPAANAGGEMAKMQAQIASLQTQLGDLESRLTRQEDIQKLRKLAFSYGYYMDNALYDQVLSLFSPNITSCEISGYGVFYKHEGCDRMWKLGMGASYGGAKNQLAFGILAKHYLLKDLITIGPDGKSAHGRFDYIGYGGRLGKPESVNQQMGVYQFDFAKEDGIWKISKFHVTFDAVNYNNRDWTSNPIIRCQSPNAKPDAPTTYFHPWPETGVTAFEDPNPVTGQPIPQVTTDTHYWTGNWPGEFGGPCGKKDGAPTAAK